MARPAPAGVSVARFKGSRALISSVALHAVVGLLLWSQAPPALSKRPPDVVELSVQTPMPPTAPREEPVAAVVAPPPTLPVVKAKVKRPVVPTTEPTPSPPIEQPPKPTFGVAAEVAPGVGDVSVPVGNSLAVAPTNTGPVAAKAPATTVGGAAAGTGSTPFASVPESFVKQLPRTLEEVQAPYPEEARRVDMGGTVRLRVGIDENGRVREVKVVKRAGYGLDEAAVKAMWKFRFAPALDQGGRPVPFRINYDYRFTSPS